MDLTTEQRTQYAAIIDGILLESDLATVSEKKIRKALSEKLGYDVTPQKAAVSKIILERFDLASKTTPPTSSSEDVPIQTKVGSNGHVEPKSENGHKRTASDSSPGADESEVDKTPPPKKRKLPDSDAKLAAKLQAEENSRGRLSRGSVNKKPPIVRKKATPKKKSAAKIKDEDDSDVELNSDGERKDVVRKGGFHKQYTLSEALASLVGENQLSRPQVVKKIWNHIKALNLQDPNDRRHILCDDKMYSVFKQEKVHMFTMNKLLGKQLYPVEEAVS